MKNRSAAAAAFRQIQAHWHRLVYFLVKAIRLLQVNKHARDTPAKTRNHSKNCVRFDSISVGAGALTARISSDAYMHEKRHATTPLDHNNKSITVQLFVAMEWHRNNK